MTQFYVPDMDNVRSDASVCDEGWHDVTATLWEGRASSTGNPMIVGQFMIDSGEDAGATLVDYFVIIGDMGQGKAKLKQFCEASGYTWRKKPDLESFAASFPVNSLRAAVHVKHDYRIKSGNTGVPRDDWKNVDEADYNDFEGEKSVSPKITGYREAANKSPDITFDTNAEAGDVPAKKSKVPF